MFDFAKFKVVEVLDGVPKEFHVFYKEDSVNGGFKLDSENPVVNASVSAITGQQRALAAARKEASDNKGSRVDLTPLSDYGSTVEEIVETFSAKTEELQKQVASKSKDGESQLNSIKEEMAKQHAKQLEAKDTENKALLAQFHSEKIGGELTMAFTKLGMIPEAIESSVKTLGGSGQLRMEKLADGRIVPRVLDANGEVAFNGAGEHKTVAEFAEDLKSSGKHDYLFKSDKRPGGGANPVDGRRTLNTGEASSVDKISQGLAQMAGK